MNNKQTNAKKREQSHERGRGLQKSAEKGISACLLCDVDINRATPRTGRRDVCGKKTNDHENCEDEKAGTDGGR